MAKVTKQIVDKDLRDRIFNDLGVDGTPVIEQEFQYHKINDRQWGVLLTDLNGEQRYVRIGAIVAELREDMTAEELMASEIEAYNQKQAEKKEKAKAKEKKIAKDKAQRAEKKQTEDNYINEYTPDELYNMLN